MKTNKILIAVAAGLVVGLAALLIGTGKGANKDVEIGAGFETSSVAYAVDEALLAPHSDKPASPLQAPDSAQSLTEVFEDPQEESLRKILGATIAGRVLDDEDVGVAQVTVRLTRGSSEQRRVTDESGEYSFDSIEPGHYRLFVEPNSLPEDVLPPWRQGVARAYTGIPTGFYGTTIRIAEAREHSVDLRVFRSASVGGRIIETGGAPVAGAIVILRGSFHRKHAARSGEDGAFTIARTYPGLYEVSVQLPGGYPDAMGRAPVPFELQVEAGSLQFMRDLIVGAEGYVLVGRVVDLDGAPFAGLLLRCAEEREDSTANRFIAQTDADGRFRLGRIPAGQFSLVFDDSESQKARGDVRLDGPTEARHLNLAGSLEEVDLGEVVLERLHSFLLRGEVKIDEAWAEANQLKGCLVHAVVRSSVDGSGAELLELREDRVPSAESGASPNVHEAVSEAQRTFEWGCVTPRTLMEVEVTLLGGRSQPPSKVVRFQPLADESLELAIEFP